MESRGVTRHRTTNNTGAVSAIANNRNTSASSASLAAVSSRTASLDQTSAQRRQAYATSRHHHNLASAPASLRTYTGSGQTVSAQSPAPRSTRTTRQRQRDAEIRRLREHTRALSERLVRGDELGVGLRQKDRLQLAALIGQLQREKQSLHQYVTTSVDTLRRQCDRESVADCWTNSSTTGGVARANDDDVKTTGDCSTLLQQLQQLERLVHEHQRVQSQFADKIAECERLASSMHLHSAMTADQWDRRLARVSADNTALTEQGRALRAQVADIGSAVDSRCDALQTSIGDVHSECRTARTQVQSLRGQVHSLESVVEQMRSAGEKRRVLLEQQQAARDELRLLVAGGGRAEVEEKDGAVSLVQQLESKIRELEKRAAAQQLQQEELMLEVAALKRSGAGSAAGNHRPGSSMSRVLSPLPSTTAANNNSNTNHRRHAVDTDDISTPDLDNNSVELTSSESPAMSAANRSVPRPQSRTAHDRVVSADQLDRLMDQLSMDNRLLNELDRSRSRAATAVPLFSSSASGSPTPATVLAAVSCQPALQPLTCLQIPPVLQLPDLLSVPGRGSCRVYIARYRYNPLHDSPNAAPEVELPLNAGDYLLVWQWPGGGEDVASFLHAELLDGRKGLVPSNYVHRLCGNELVEFHQQVIGESAIGDCDVNMTNTAQIRSDIGYHNAANETMFQFGGGGVVDGKQIHQGLPVESALSQAPPNLMAAEDGDPSVPAPQFLTLERRMNRSVVVGWRAAPPSIYSTPPIQCYHVYVDGLLRCSVRVGERLRALLECIDMSRVHRVCVRAVTACAGTGTVPARFSPDAACTLLIGEGAPVAPTCVRAVDVTANSAVITWLPSNSALQHSVCVNNVEVCRVDPGVFRHRIAGIVPGTLCRVTVNVHGASAVGGAQTAGSVAPLVEFRTPTSSVPEPPLDVQCEPGPRRGTLLVTWLPVTIAASGGTSNGALVTGYAVYADGQRVAELDSPTGDHTVVHLQAIDGFRPRYVTVRTKSTGLCVSRDSQPFAVPLHCYDQQQQQQNQQTREYEELSAIAEHVEPTDSHVYNQQPTQPSVCATDGPGRLWADSGPSVPHIEITGDSASEEQYSLMTNTVADGEEMPVSSGRRNYAAGGSADRYRPPISNHQQQQQQRRRRTVKDAAMGRSATGTRLFVALFDYDPPTMSPNPDACQAELAFCEGQLLRVYGDKDADGFFWGEPVDASGRVTLAPATGSGAVGGGLVPCNMVSEVQLQDDEEFVSDANVQQQPQHQQDRWGDIYCSMPTRRMVALYDYDPRELSPNVDAEVELSFRTGDVILVLGDMDDDGFYMGEIGGVRGLVPSNFLTEAPEHYDQQQQQTCVDRRGGSVGHGPGVHGPPLPPRHRQTASRHPDSDRRRRGPAAQHHQQPQQNTSGVEHRSRNK